TPTPLYANQSLLITTPIDSKIASFANLPVGWRYGTGGPIEASMIVRGLSWRIFLNAAGFSNLDAFPDQDGGILIAAIDAAHYIEIILEANGFVSIGHDINDAQAEYLSHIDELDAIKAITRIRGEIWSASASFIQRNTISGYTGSPV